MNVPPTITYPPLSQSYKLGDIANITCVASGQPAPNYRWFFNDNELLDEISPYYIIPSIGTEHRGIYYCNVTNEAGYAKSAKAEISIEGTPFKFVYTSLQTSVLTKLQVCSSIPWHLLSQRDVSDKRKVLKW